MIKFTTLAVSTAFLVAFSAPSFACEWHNAGSMYGTYEARWAPHDLNGLGEESDQSADKDVADIAATAASTAPATQSARPSFSTIAQRASARAQSRIEAQRDTEDSTDSVNLD